MFRLLCSTAFIFCYLVSVSQISDFISVRKKNGRIIKSFYAGSPIVVETVHGSYLDGWVNEIKNDSVFVKIFDIRYYRAAYGGTIIDTVRSYIIPVHHKEIKGIKVFERRKSAPAKIGKLLVISGAGYFLLNLANGAYLNESVTDKKNVNSLGISLGLLSAGLLINRLFKPTSFSEKKHKVVYVKMEKTIL